MFDFTQDLRTKLIEQFPEHKKLIEGFTLKISDVYEKIVIQSKDYKSIINEINKLNLILNKKSPDLYNVMLSLSAIYVDIRVVNDWLKEASKKLKIL